MDSRRLDGHLDELAASLEPTAGGAHISPTDSCLSIENTCRNALDDELAGAVSRLFNRGRGLPRLLQRSMDVAQSHERLLQDLRTEVLKLIDTLILELRARERLAIVGEYVCEIAYACLRIFRVVQDSKVRAEAINTLIAAIELRDYVPNLSELQAMLFPPKELCAPAPRPAKGVAPPAPAPDAVPHTQRDRA